MARIQEFFKKSAEQLKKENEADQKENAILLAQRQNYNKSA